MHSSAIKFGAVAILVVATTAGCTSSSKVTTGGSHAATSTSSTSPAKKAAAPTLVQNPLPTKVANQPAVRKDVAQTSCTAVAGGWRAAGTVTNSGAKMRTYKIVAYFTTVHATTLDFAQTTVKVDAGKTAKWQASKKFAAQKQMNCVLAGISAT